MEVTQVPQMPSGVGVAAELQKRYDETIRMCNGASSQPAFLCSGLMLRATDTPNGFHVWDPSPGAIELGGMSFSYLRKDASFRHMPWDRNNGYIIYPVLKRPVGTVQTMVLCVFPIDGATWGRDKPGCGASDVYPVVSKRCQSQNITTAEQWVAHTFTHNVDYFRYQCSFDVRDEMNELAADSFYQAIRAIALKPVGRPGFNEFSELIIKTWPKGIPAQLPIEAFFYVDSGLAVARYNQRDFYNESKGKIVPIIKLTMPTSTQNARFELRQEDQDVAQSRLP
ncbi:hypothetical protein [Pseudomonas sp. AD21]|uniref:hypothetical protein n=1 Tax=Pseudomonas sp. AD21 TaxID=396378 RepID=UPI002114DCC2|nr:hypothetical protein [Pseudomonas sp. AD21]